MSDVVLKIDDGKDDVYLVDSFDTVTDGLDLADIDGGQLVVLTAARSVGVRTVIKLKKEGAKPAKKTVKKAVKKSSKGSK